MAESSPGAQPGWKQIDPILDQALELEGQALESFLDGLDASIRVRIESALTGESAELVDTLVRTSLDGGLKPLGRELIPDTVGPWRIVRELGAGGMAQVFEARRRDADFEQRAAVKIIWPFRIGEKFQERFVQERRILAGLNHPGIAGLLDGGMLPDNRPWFAMEYVEGVRIDEYCRGRSLTERLAVFLQVCDAVEFAHGRLIIHRDIKPANILVDEAGRARLLDFGIAKLMDEVEDAALTQTGGSLLTLQYASPEQVTRAPITAASDIYQLGMLLYQLLALRPPYDLEGQSLSQAVEIINTQDPPAPSRFGSDVGSDLDAVVMFALRKEPSQRYRSVSALARDVRQYLEGRPVMARPQSRWYVFSRFVRRNALLVGATIVVLLALVSATLVSLSMAQRANLEADRSATALQVLTSVFDQADPFGQPGPDITLGDALIERFDRVARQVDHDPALAVQVFNYLGRIFTDLGLHDHAQRAHEAALGKVEALTNAGSTDRLTAVAGIAEAVNDQGHFQEALEFVNGLEPGSPATAEEARLHAKILLEQAMALLRTGQYDEGDAALLRAQALLSEFNLTDPVLSYQLNQAFAEVAGYREDFVAAETYMRTAAAHAAEAGDLGAEATYLQNVAIFLGRQGRFDDAQPYFLEAMAMVDEHAPGHPIKLKFAANYAGWLYRTGKAQLAVELLQDTITDMKGKPARHHWAIAHRDLAFYAFSTESIDLSIRANLEFLTAAPELYGEDSPNVAVASVMLARHLSLGGINSAALDVIQRAYELHPRLEVFDLAAFRAELQIDAGSFDAAIRGYQPGDNSKDPNAVLLKLKFACIRNDLQELEAEVAAIDPTQLGDSHIDGRLLAWRTLMNSALTHQLGREPVLELESVYSKWTRTQRVTGLEKWRFLRGIVAAHGGDTVLPGKFADEWAAIERQRGVAREILVNDGRVAELANAPISALSRSLASPTPSGLPALVGLKPEFAHDFADGLDARLGERRVVGARHDAQAIFRAATGITAKAHACVGRLDFPERFGNQGFIQPGGGNAA